MAKSLRVPKRIAGVKIPKRIRKGPIGDFLNSSGGQLLMAEALLAIGAVYAARRFEPNSQAGEALRHPLESLRAGGGWSRDTAERLGRAFSAGVQAFREALHESGTSSGLITEPGTMGPGAAAAEAAGASEPSRKKPSSRSEPPLRDASTSH